MSYENLYKQLTDDEAARNRAPLGIKTTNAKAKTVQATAPLTIGNDSALKQPKSRSPRLRRLKVTVQQPEFKHALTQDEEPDTEYAPPPPQGEFVCSGAVNSEL